MKVDEGKLYWSLEHSVEAMNYLSGGGPIKPCRPWQGQLMFEKRPGGTCLVLYRLKADGTRDEDANAYAVVDALKLFVEEEQAAIAYVDALALHAKRLTTELGRVLEEMSSYYANRKRGRNAG